MKYLLAILIACLISFSLERRQTRFTRAMGRNIHWRDSDWWKTLQSRFLKFAKRQFQKKYTRKPEKVGTKIAANDEWITCGIIKGKKCLKYQIVPIPTGCAVLYQNCNFSGWKLLVCDTVPSLSSHRNDKVSSIKVGKKTKATLYEDLEFGGRSLSLNRQISCLIKHSFNDITSSLKLSKTK